MAFERYVDGFDFCDPPLCDGDITVEIVEMNCADWILEVGWIIHDVYNRIFTSFDFFTVVWSINSQSLDSSSDAYDTNSPYHANINLQNQSGIVYLQATIGISGSTFKSSIVTFDISDCIDNSTYMVRAKLCICVPPQPIPIYDLYVKENAFSSVPRYFKYGNLCWYIDSNAWDNKVFIDNNLGKIVIESLDDQYDSCESCCFGLSCPSEWEDDGVGGLQADFYIEYSTYDLRDHVVVIRNFEEANDCVLSNLPQNKIIWQSGCVATMLKGNDADCDNRPCDGSPLGEGVGQYIYEIDRRSIQGASSWNYLFNGVKACCFMVHQDDLPIGVLVEPNCEGTSNTSWCVYIEGPSGYNTTVCNEDDGICLPIPASSSSSSISSVSSSSSSISSSSSSSVSSSSSSSISSSSSSSISSSSSSSVSSSSSSVSSSSSSDTPLSSSSSSISSSSSSISSSSSSSVSSSSSSSVSSSSSSSISSSSSSSISSSSSSSISSSSSSSISSSSSSSVSSSSSSVSSSSSSVNSSSSSSDHHIGGKGLPEAFILTPYKEEELQQQYNDIKHEFSNLSNIQKEDKLIQMVTDGEISVHIAVYIAIQEGLDVES